jgi:nucleotide-binding universal stress UspA family protein
MALKFLVAYKGTPEGQRALEVGAEHARRFNASLYVVTSHVGGAREKPEEVARAQKELKEAKAHLADLELEAEVFETVRGMSAGEDLVRYAKDNRIDHIFVGVEKKSRTQKLILGSTAQYIILKSHCPVTTVKRPT